MEPTTNAPHASPNLDGLRSALFSSAKVRWYGGLIAAYLAIFAVPAFACLQTPRWIGAIVALLLVIVGALLRAWSDIIRGDAEALHRANELHRGIDYPIDPGMISELCHRYFRLGRLAGKRQRDQADYYENDGEPSVDLLIAMVRESAWYTSRLAACMRNCVWVIAGVGLVAPVAVLLLDVDRIVRIYGALACTVMLMDLFYLGWRYGRLRMDSDKSFNALNQVHRMGATERTAIILATTYQMTRASGPLLPDRLQKGQTKRLQAAWSAALGSPPTSS